MFIKTPFLPNNKVKCVIVDCTAPRDFIKNLNNLGIETVNSVKLENLIGGVSSHPDMQIFHMGGNKIICEPSTFEYYSNALKKYGFEVICGNSKLNSNYPYDIAYNVLYINGIVVHKISNTEEIILKHFKANNHRILSTKQGYTKCASCIISDNAVITQDINIANTLLNTNVDVLLIDNDNIKLDGVDYGFIGGCSGLIDKSVIAFCGEIKTHKNYNQIKDFTSKHGVSIISLFDGKLRDIGSVIPIIEE